MNLLGSASMLANDSPNPPARVQVKVRLDNGRNARAEVAILIFQDDNEPFHVVSWRDDIDGPI